MVPLESLRLVGGLLTIVETIIGELVSQSCVGVFW